MEKLNDIEEKQPRCIFGPWGCHHEALWPTLREHGSAYAGHRILCDLCVKWALVKQLRNINTELATLRATAH